MLIEMLLDPDPLSIDWPMERILPLSAAVSALRPLVSHIRELNDCRRRRRLLGRYRRPIELVLAGG